MELIRTMHKQRWGWLWDGLAWLALPVIPVILAGWHHDFVNWSPDLYRGPDPTEWDWFLWVAVPGPLLGYGFLAGATVGLPDDPDVKGWRRWFSRRAVWVTCGPWAGLLGALPLLVLMKSVPLVVPLATVPALTANTLGQWWFERISSPARLGDLSIASAAVLIVSYGWLLPAAAVVRRAARRDLLRPALQRGLALMIAFVGSLFASFWAAVEVWRSYYFDTRIAPVLLAALSLTTLSGCASTLTYGEIRRRDLFQALLVSWILGLALAWRWWSRPKGKK